MVFGDKDRFNTAEILHSFEEEYAMKKLLSTVGSLALLTGLTLLILVLPAHADPPYNSEHDVNRDNKINTQDIMLVAANWGAAGTWTCPCAGGLTCSDCDSRFVNTTEPDYIQSNTSVSVFSVINQGSGKAVDAWSTSGIAVYGESGSSSGVYGVTSAASTAAVAGRSTGSSGVGVYGEGNNNVGVWGYGKTGVYGAGSSGGYGVLGYNTSGQGGRFTTDNGDGVYGSAKGVGMWGVWGTSASSYGVLGNTDVSGGYGLYTNDKIYTGGGCVGCTSMLIAQNGDDKPLELGDIVVISGIADPISPEATRPVLVVRKADTASSQGVVGVVEGRYVSQLVTKRQEEQIVVEDAHTSEEPAAPGEYLTVVYRGLARVKVDGSFSAIKVGDLLTSSSTVGHAMKAGLTAAQGEKLVGGYLPGTIIGKALEPL